MRSSTIDALGHQPSTIDHLSLTQFTLRHQLNRLLLSLWRHPLGEARAAVVKAALSGAARADLAAALAAMCDTWIYCFEVLQ